MTCLTYPPATDGSPALIAQYYVQNRHKTKPTYLHKRYIQKCHQNQTLILQMPIFLKKYLTYSTVCESYIQLKFGLKLKSILECCISIQCSEVKENNKYKPAKFTEEIIEKNKKRNNNSVFIKFIELHFIRLCVNEFG